MRKASHDAGDLMPTFTGASDVDAHREAVNDQYESLNKLILASKVSNEFKTAWDQQYGSWKKFYAANKAESSFSKFMSARSMYAQIDQFAKVIPDWSNRFQQAGGTIAGLSYQSLADEKSTAESTLTTLVVGGAIIAIAAYLIKREK